MNRTAGSFLLALLGAALWVGWMAEHELTSIRAPWTGLTLMASGAAFIATGVVGRRWPALTSPMVVVPAAMVVTDLLVYSDVDVDETFVSSCDPGCIPTWFAILTLALATCLLIAIGIVLRRAFRMLRHASEASQRP
jgi:hypothetical protein